MMTAIAIWCNHENPQNPSLWIAADSRITGSGASRLIEDGAKVFGLPVICRSPGEGGFFSKVHYAHTYGYCFAGSTLMGQNAYLALAPLLMHLNSDPGYIPPFAEIARYVLSYLCRTFDDYVRAGSTGLFEVALFGHCRCTNNLSVFHYFPQVGSNGVYRMTYNAHENMQAHDFVYLGDAKTHMSSSIATAFGGTTVPGRPLSRIPRYIIQDHIDDPAYVSIGGDIQLGIADRFGFQPYTLVKPRTPGQPAAYISYLGRELTPDMTYVGNAMVSGPAIV